MARGRGGRHAHEEEPEDGERWLLTYADMITLLMALFMVLFSISSVNTSKFESLQKSLADAFSGRIMGGQSIKQSGGSVQAQESNPAVNQTSLAPLPSQSPRAKAEQEDFRKLKAQIDQLVAKQGLSRQIESTIEKRGLAVRVMTDGLLFDSGSADVRPQALPLLHKLGGVLATDKVHPVRVEGHTDNVPISGRYPSNWELSTARSSAVVRTFMSAGGIPARRFEAVGRAQLDALASNATEAGRAKNRRVEIVLPRKNAEPAPLTPRQELEVQLNNTPSTATEGTR